MPSEGEHVLHVARVDQRAPLRRREGHHAARPPRLRFAGPAASRRNAAYARSSTGGALASRRSSAPCRSASTAIASIKAETLPPCARRAARCSRVRVWGDTETEKVTVSCPVRFIL